MDSHPLLAALSKHKEFSIVWTINIPETSKQIRYASNTIEVTDEDCNDT